MVKRLFKTARVRKTDTFVSFSRLLELTMRCAVADLTKFVWLSIRRQSITMPTEAHVKGTRRVCVIHTAVIQTL